jgi:hypothetical protein
MGALQFDSEDSQPFHGVADRIAIMQLASQKFWLHLAIQPFYGHVFSLAHKVEILRERISYDPPAVVALLNPL